MFYTVQILFLFYVHYSYCDRPQWPATDQIPGLPKIDFTEQNNNQQLQSKQSGVDQIAGQYYQGEGNQGEENPTGYAGQGGNPSGYAGQGGNPTGYAGQGGNPSGYAGQGGNPSGYAGQGGNPSGYAGQGGNPSGYAGQGGNPTGYAGQGGNPTGYAGQGGNPSGYAGQGGNPSGFAGQGGNPSGYAGQGGNPSGYAGQGGNPTGYAGQGGNPTGYADQGGNPTGYAGQGGNPTGYAGQGGNPSGHAGQGGGNPSGYASQGGGNPSGYASQGGKPTGYPSPSGNPIGIRSQSGNPIGYAGKGVSDDGQMESGTGDMRLKLEKTLSLAQTLAKTLQDHIVLVSAREQNLKDVISNGRYGVTTVKVSTMNFFPRVYTVRDGFWTMCNGAIQTPVKSTSRSVFNELFSSPKCIGKEVVSKRDPCSFNSIIKYETVPTQRGFEYTEDDVLCLKPSFNVSMEQYLSVSRKTVKDTCSNGLVRSIEENIQECGLRSMTEYTFYPDQSAVAANLPLEYCTEPDGTCKLIVAWHLSNATIENFEFLRNEPQFQQYFIKSAYLNHFI